MFYDHKLPSGKNNNTFYYIRAYLRLMEPRCLFRRRLKGVLASFDRRTDKDYILDRVNYYNKLDAPRQLPPDAVPLREFRKPESQSVYFHDSYEFLRWFPRDRRVAWRFGDVTQIPPGPAILKSRPVAGDNANSVVLNLVKMRHFTFLDDKKAFRDKLDKAVFRGHIGDLATTLKRSRVEMMQKFLHNDTVDVGVWPGHASMPREWYEGKYMSMWEQLECKFVISLEGNDVATNIKWIMSSNSVAVSPPMVYETWYMEGRLIPGVHYIGVKSDFSDLEEKIAYYSAHPDEAERIIQNAHRWIEQFLDPERERLISLMVLQKYFDRTF